MPTPFTRKAGAVSTAAAPIEGVAQASVKSDFLRIEDKRGGMYLCVDITEVTGWQQELSARSADEALGLRVFLANGETVALLQVSFSFFTSVMREHFGIAFDSYFVANEYETLYLRRAHVLGFSGRQGYTLHMRGQHQISGIRLTAADLSIQSVMLRRQPESEPDPQVPPAPLQRFPVYSPEKSYAFHELVLHRGTLYRRASRSGAAGDPLEDVDGWDLIRTLEGPEPQRVKGAKASVSSRRPVTAEYTVHGTYSHGDLVRFKGRLYRKMTRSTRDGQPDQSPEDWDCISEPETLGLMRA